MLVYVLEPQWHIQLFYNILTTNRVWNVVLPYTPNMPALKVRPVLESILGADAINTSFGAQGDTMSDGMSGEDFVEEAVEGDY